MGFLDKIINFFSGAKNSKLVELKITDDNCGNEMNLVFRKSSEILKVQAENRDAAYEINKVVICDSCYNKIKLKAEFDKNYNLIKKETKNIKFNEKNTFNEKDIKKAIKDKKKN